jgi:hypothetical protein
MPADVIYLNGLYVEPLFLEGMKGFRIYHDSEYFKEKQFVLSEPDQHEKWIRAVKQHAAFYDIPKRYEKIRQIGQGKFSTVHLVRSVEGDLGDADDLLAMKQLDKKQLTRKEREFLRDEI